MCLSAKNINEEESDVTRRDARKNKKKGNEKETPKLFRIFTAARG
jgi:hypothetical protein